MHRRGVRAQASTLVRTDVAVTQVHAVERERRVAHVDDTALGTDDAGGSTTDGGSSETGAFDCELFGLNDGEAVCVGGEHSSEVALCLDGLEAYGECNFGYWCEAQDATHADCVCDLQADDLCPDGGECPEDPDCG